ncbi:MAG TPA: nitronate monooxygenase, partial [Actinomycetota bacterium]|nr:nitronate monooxygenase [Actinomycetota bacterium]
MRTVLCDLLGIRFPIIQDGMGPFSTAALAAAVSEAGGLGTVSIPGMLHEPDEARRLMRAEIEATASGTERGFAVNVPVGVGPAGDPLPPTAAYLQAVLEAKRDRDLGGRLVACITSAGLPSPEVASAFHEAGLLHIHKVGAVRHARKAVAAGADAVIASGFEMGGHTHAHPVHTMVLAPQVVAAVDVPVVVAGGLFDGRGLAAALAMGAAGIAMGTRFIATEENDWHPAYKRAIVESGEWGDVLFPGFFGPVRGLDNPGARRLIDLIRSGELGEEELGVWKEERLVAAQRDGEVEDGILVAGQCAAAIDGIVSVHDLLPDMVREAAGLLEVAAR